MDSIQIYVVVRRIPCVHDDQGARAHRLARTIFNASFLVSPSDLGKLLGDDFDPRRIRFQALLEDNRQRAHDLLPVCLPSSVGLAVTPLLPAHSPTIDFARRDLMVSGGTAQRILELNGASVEPDAMFRASDSVSLPDYFFAQIKDAYQRALQYDDEHPSNDGYGAVVNFEASLASVFYLGKRVLLPNRVQEELPDFWRDWLTNVHEIATSASGQSARVQSANLQFLVGASRVWSNVLPDGDLTLAVRLSIAGTPDQIIGVPAPSIEAVRMGFEKLQGSEVSVEPQIAWIDRYLKLGAEWGPPQPPIADWVPRKRLLAAAMVPRGPREPPREWEPFMAPGLPVFTRVDLSGGLLGDDSVRIAIHRSPEKVISAASRVLPAFSVELDVRKLSAPDSSKKPHVWEAVPRQAYERLFDLLAFVDPHRDHAHAVNVRVHAVVLRSDDETVLVDATSAPEAFEILGLFGDGRSEAPAPEDAVMRMIFASSWDNQITSAVVFLSLPDWIEEFSLEVSSDDPAEYDVGGLLLPLPSAIVPSARRAVRRPWLVHPDTFFFQGDVAQALRDKSLVALVTSPALAALVPRDSVGSLDFHLGIRPPVEGDSWSGYIVPKQGLLGDFCKVVPWVEVFAHGDAQRATSRRSLLLPSESLLPLHSAQIDAKPVWPYRVHARASELTKPADLRPLAQRSSEQFVPQFQRLFALGLAEPLTAAAVLERKRRAANGGYYDVECEIEDSHGQRITVRNLRPHPGQNVKRVLMIDASAIESASRQVIDAGAIEPGTQVEGVLSFRVILGPRGSGSMLAFDLTPSRLGATSGELSPDQARLIAAVADIALASTFKIIVWPLQLSTRGLDDSVEPLNDASRHLTVRQDVLGQAASNELDGAGSSIQEGCRRLVTAWANGSAPPDELGVFLCGRVLGDLEVAGVTAFAITYEVGRRETVSFDLETTVARRRDQAEHLFGQSVALGSDSLASLTDLPQARHTYAALVPNESLLRSRRVDLPIWPAKTPHKLPALDVAAGAIGIASGTVELDPLLATVDLEQVFFAYGQEPNPEAACVDLSVWGRRPCRLPWAVGQSEVVLDRLLGVLSRLPSASGVAVEHGGRSVFSPVARREFLRSLARNLIVPVYLSDGLPTHSNPQLAAAIAGWIDDNPLRGSRSRVHALIAAQESSDVRVWWESIVGIKARLRDVDDSAKTLLVESRFAVSRRDLWFASGPDYPAVLADVPIPPGRAGVLEGAECGVYTARLRALSSNGAEPASPVKFRAPGVGSVGATPGIEVPALSDQPIAPIACRRLSASKCQDVDRLDQVEIELVMSATLSTVRSAVADPTFLTGRDAYGVATMTAADRGSLRLDDAPAQLAFFTDDTLSADSRIAGLVETSMSENDEFLAQLGRALEEPQPPDDTRIKQHWLSAVVTSVVNPNPVIGVQQWSPALESSALAELLESEAGIRDGTIEVTLRFRVPIWHRQALLAFHARDSRLTQPEINPAFAQTSTLVLSEARLFPELDHDLVALDPVEVPLEEDRWQIPLYDLLDQAVAPLLGGNSGEDAGVDKVMVLFTLGRVSIEVCGLAPAGPVKSLEPLNPSTIASQKGGAEFPTYLQTFAEGTVTGDGIVRSEMVTLEQGYVAYRISVFVHPKHTPDRSPASPEGVDPGVGAVLRIRRRPWFVSPL